MTDLEMTRLCAKAMGLKTIDAFGHPHAKWDHWPSRDTSCEKTGVGLKCYDPLHNDGQAMELVKKLKMAFAWDVDTNDWWARTWQKGHAAWMSTGSADLNRAIVEAVAKMQAGQTDLPKPPRLREKWSS